MMVTGMCDGTSFAAPFVSGLIALLLSEYPELTTDEVITNLSISVEDLGKESLDNYYIYGLYFSKFNLCNKKIYM